MHETIVAPSLLAADFANLQRDVELVNNSDAGWFHLDVMDGVFVPNISFGMPVIKSIAAHAKLPLDVHLMIVDPDRYLSTFADLGTHMLTVHYEVCTHLHRTICGIKELGMKAGVALNPHTPVQLLSDILPDLDMVCIMSVNPGFGGQSFIEHTYNKVSQLDKMKQELDAEHVLVEIDGGVGLHNAEALKKVGASVLVAGSAVFKSEDPRLTISKLKG